MKEANCLLYWAKRLCGVCVWEQVPPMAVSTIVSPTRWSRSGRGCNQSRRLGHRALEGVGLSRPGRDVVILRESGYVDHQAAITGLGHSPPGHRRPQPRQSSTSTEKQISYDRFGSEVAVTYPTPPALPINVGHLFFVWQRRPP